MNYGRYQIVKEIGKGAMGIVYKAHDPQIDRTLALKVMRGDALTSDYLLQRFLKEAKAIGRLSHPNIVTVYDAGQDNDTVFIAMEFLRGRDLRDRYDQERPERKDVLSYGIQTAEALDYAHQQGIVHRDIKPSNIHVDDDGLIKITDFGIAHIDDPSTTQQTVAGEVLGTPEYMSPEQVMGKPVDGRSDLYSLGIILYELITGQKPFLRDNIPLTFKAIMQENPSPPNRIDNSIPRALSQLIMQCIARDPAQRIQNGRELARRLKDLSVENRAEGPTIAIPPPPKKRLKKAPAIVAALFLVVVTGGAAYYFFRTTEPDKPLTEPVAPPTKMSQPLVEPLGPPAEPLEPLAKPFITPVKPLEPPPKTAEPVKPTMPGVLNVQSEPTGAQLFVNNAFKGKTPLKLELPPGQYEIRMDMSGYYNWEAQIELDEAGEIPLFIELIQEE